MNPIEDTQKEIIMKQSTLRSKVPNMHFLPIVRKNALCDFHQVIN